MSYMRSCKTSFRQTYIKSWKRDEIFHVADIQHTDTLSGLFVEILIWECQNSFDIIT